jgi:hypothetical protein
MVILNIQSSMFVILNITLSKEVEMRFNLIALTLLTLSVLWGPTPASADEPRTARGTIAAIAGQSLTVKVGDQNMKFGVDNKTMVTARGATMKTALAVASGKAGAHLDALLQPGQTVDVSYHDMGGSFVASAITAIPQPPSEPTSMKSAGIVKSIRAEWITINGHSGGGAAFEQTFKIDAGTKVFAKGASAAVSVKDGKAPFPALVAAGDHVSVSYEKAGNALRASEVHVTMKATH